MQNDENVGTVGGRSAEEIGQSNEMSGRKFIESITLHLPIKITLFVLFLLKRCQLSFLRESVKRRRAAHTGLVWEMASLLFQVSFA